jgi:hypothetical protein
MCNDRFDNFNSERDIPILVTEFQNELADRKGALDFSFAA